MLFFSENIPGSVRARRQSVFSLGGNLLPGPKMMQAAIAGGGGRIWSTLSQYGDLVKTVQSGADPGGPRILVSHVSPGKEPFVEVIGVRTRADYTISGHRGTPAYMVWTASAVNSEEEAEQRLWAGFRAVRDACMAQAGANLPDEAFGSIAAIPADSIRGEPRWHRGMTHINLPDASVGYALVDRHAEIAALRCYGGSNVQQFSVWPFSISRAAEGPVARDQFLGSNSKLQPVLGFLSPQLLE